MKAYIQDLLPRILQFSKKLDNTALFIEKPWVLIDNDTSYYKYIFKRDGQLIMSANGLVQVGNWEYFAEAKSILIDRIKDKVLLNHAFIDDAVMLLRVDGLNNSIFILANEAVIPNLDVVNYLKTIINKRQNSITGILDDGRFIEIHRLSHKTPLRIGLNVSINGLKAIDGRYKSSVTERSIYVKNGKIHRIAYSYHYQTIDGISLTIEQFRNRISKGDFVYINNKMAKTGTYKLSPMKSLIVENGVIKKLKMF